MNVVVDPIVPLNLSALPHTLHVSRELLADQPIDIIGWIRVMERIDRKQGTRCAAVRRNGERCSRRWRHVADDAGWCWQHRPEVTP